MGVRSEPLRDDLHRLIRSVIEPGQMITTLDRAQPNHIVAIAPEGIYVETLASNRKGSGAQLVPAWMVNTGWNHLVERGRLTQPHLLDVLGVKRSAFVMALLAQLPNVSVVRTRPTELRYAK